MPANQSDSGSAIVMLAADANSYSKITVSLAVALAASANTRLNALFIEDEDLLQVTSLPCTREITLTTARERPTSSNQMERSLRLVAQQFKEALQQEAKALQIVWSFDTVRGRVRDVGLRTEANVSYTILGQPVSHRLQARPKHGVRKILLIANDSPCQKHALEMLLRRFMHQNIELTLVVSDHPGSFVSRLSQQLRNFGGQIALNLKERDQLDDLLDQTGPSFDCAIMSKHEGSGATLRVLEKLRCPVILVA